MRTKFLLISAAGMFSLVQTARANVLYYDSFDYAVQTPSATFTTAATLGQNEPWQTAHMGHAGDPVQPWDLYQRGSSSPYVGSGSLSYPGLAVDPNPNSNNAHYRGDGFSGSGDSYRWFGQPTTWDGTSSPPFTTYPVDTPKTLYYSLLVRVTSMGTPSVGGNFTGGQIMTAFTDVTSDDTGGQTAQGNSAGALMFKPTNDDAASTTYQLGIGNTINTQTVYPAGTFDLNQTHFIVVAYIMTAGTNTAKLYIDPTPGSLESGNAVAASLTGEPGGTLNAFALKDDTHLPSGLSIDELRIGETWDDVTPAAPEPAALSLLAMPALLALSRRRRRRA